MLATTLAIGLPAAIADNEGMRQGFAEFNSGNYSEAAGHLQGALATDFNNAKLHYYLANTYIHLNQKEAGIREYRIAFALEPDKEVGKLSKQALGYLGVDSDKPKETETKTSEPRTASDPILDKIKANLQMQADLAKGNSGDAASRDIARRLSDLQGAPRYEPLKDLSIYRRGRLIQLPLPDEALKQLDNLKQMYDAQKNRQSGSSSNHSEEVQKSADNLNGLLNDKGKIGSPQLVPEGTNLYTRNYKYEPTSHASPPTATPPASTPAKHSATSK
jgi:tetratricopeptide (TPR) repeat protein